MIRFFLGLILVMGGVGHIDVSPTDQDLVQGVMVSALGLILLYFGADRVRRDYGHED